MAKETYIYDTAANGMTVRIPLSRYEAWKKAQDEIRAGKKFVADPEMKKRLLSLIRKK